LSKSNCSRCYLMTNTVAEQVPPLAHYRLLGNSGLRVSPLCLGCMGYGKAWQDIMGEHTEPEAILDTYVEAGGNFLDMANKYNEGETEEIIGEWMKKRGNRDRMVIATKFSIGMRKNDPNAVGNHRKNMFSSVRDSLRRLQTDYIDLLYVHFWDFTTPIEEVMSSFHDLVSAGKVHYVAFSDTPAWVVAKANTIAEFRGWPRVAAYQGRYSLGVYWDKESSLGSIREACNQR
jgi:aryl-alcohol dehydrogenase-like predicted oxidoreductase